MNFIKIINNYFNADLIWSNKAKKVVATVALTASLGVMPMLLAASSYGLYRAVSACCTKNQMGSIKHISVEEYPKIEKIASVWLSFLNDKEIELREKNECFSLELEDSKNIIEQISESLAKNKKSNFKNLNNVYVFEDYHQEIRGIMTTLSEPEYISEDKLAGKYLYLDYLATDPRKIINRNSSSSKEKNLRVGTRMVEKAMNIAKLNGLKGVILVDSGKSKSFYEKIGFKHFEEHSLFMYKLVSESIST